MLNSQKYTSEDINKAFTKKELAIAVADGTCWEETVSTQMKLSKDALIEYLFEDMDALITIYDSTGDFDPEDCDLFKVIREANERYNSK